MESGSALSPWAYQREQTENSFMTAGFLDSEFEIDNRDSGDLLLFMQGLSARDVDRASVYLTNELVNNHFIFISVKPM